jgi:hypothetical protein
MVACVGVTGSAADGTVLADSDLDVDLIVQGPQPEWGEGAWGAVRDLAGNLHTCGSFRIVQTTHRLIVAVYSDTEELGTGPKEVDVDMCVKWTDGLAVSGFGPAGQVRRVGLLRDVQKTCAAPEVALDAIKQAVVVVKAHVKTRRPGIKSCHVSLLSRHLIPTGILARDVQMLWALVVTTGVHMMTDGLDYEEHAGLYAGHPEYLLDVPTVCTQL